MAEIVTYFSLTVANKPGEGAKLLTSLKDAGINMLGFWGYPVKGKKAQLDIAPTEPKAFTKAAKKLGLEISAKQSSLYVAGADQPGTVADALAKLAAAGISVRAAQALSTGDGKFAVLIQVADDDVKKAKKALK